MFQSTFETVPERPAFPKEEEDILKYWRDIDAFQTSFKQSVEDKRPRYLFYDGPPFATGLPHYGHILAGTIKDIVTRYAHQTGYCVERRFGWDCHGLPIEFEIDKELNVTCRKDVVETIGISTYNDKCRSIVMRYSNEWRRTVERMGRWIDFENDYKTLNKDYMESVWWVFKQLFDRGLVYRAFKVMPYSTACTTPLSNFEANQNYKDISDPSIVVTFPSIIDPHLEFIAWTTTPWTLPSNLALCVHPDLLYVRVKRVPKQTSSELTHLRDWIIVESRLPWLASQLKMTIGVDLLIVGTPFPGSHLKDHQYKPLFDYYYRLPEWKNSAFRIIIDSYPTDDTGTGCVHCAPAFGEDDYRVCLEHGIISREGTLPCPVDDDGLFTSEVDTFKGLYIKDADKLIKEEIKKCGRLLINSDFIHSYPHCWRSDKPLIYRAVPSWFIRVEQMREDLVENNKLTNWVPTFVQEKRFHNWLTEARDWCVSRNRYWGTPIPLWVNDDFTQIICIGSIQELETYIGYPLTDIHRQFIDHITIPDPRGSSYPPLKRIEEVFDCWFESGSMPYAQLHYPFENQDIFNTSFPADFVAEGLDQTRGWFYTLMVLSTALFKKPAFKHLIVNGLVLASDGKKMSKRLQNYPDPSHIFDRYGADSLRLFLVNSPVVKAESLKFREDGVRDVVRDVLLPWYHVYRFFCQEATRFENTHQIIFKPNDNRVQSSKNIMDRWIYGLTQHLIEFVRNEMMAYRLYTVVPELIHFLTDLTNWYVRLNRDRMRGQFGKEDAFTSLCVLFDVLISICRLMSPFTPFLTELIYKNLKRAFDSNHVFNQDSIHYVMMPDSLQEYIANHIEASVRIMQNIIISGRILRERQHVSLKTPLKEMTIVCTDQNIQDSLEPLLSYIKDELNILDINFSMDSSIVKLTAVPNFKALGTRAKKDMPYICKLIKELTIDQLIEFQKTDQLILDHYTLGKDDLIIKREPTTTMSSNILVESVGDVLIVMNFVTDPKLRQMALAREIANRIQKLRKQLNLSQEDKIGMFIDTNTPALQTLLIEQEDYINKCLRRPVHQLSTVSLNQASIIHNEIIAIDEDSVHIVFTKQE